MHFDDRLATVLRLPVSGRAIARIQYRQLIDLLGSAVDPAGSIAMLDAAATRLDELGALISAGERAAILREPMTRLASPELVARLVTAEPDVASAAIAAADLSEAQWIALIPALPVRARGILRHRRGFGPRVEAVLEQLGIGDRGLPPATVMATPAPERPQLVVVEGGAGTKPRRRLREEPSSVGIGAIVRRIEAFRSARTNPDDDGNETLQSKPERQTATVLALNFTTDSDGRIDWADSLHAPGLVGGMLAGMQDEASGQAMRQRQPLRAVDVVLAGAPALAGAWRLDALPRFGGRDGRFLGYAGRLRRARITAPPVQNASSAADSMREVLHELRTPANAIQVAAEIIQQQLYGPAPHEYRALAAAIAGDTAQILAGFEELDRLVRLESSALTIEAGECDFGPLLLETVARLRGWTTPRGSRFRVPDGIPPLAVALEREEAARLVWRLLAALAGASASGETIALDVQPQTAGVMLTIAVPEALAARLDEAAEPGQSNGAVRSLSAGIFGIGFTLRLAAAEAAAAGGRLLRDGASFALTLPGLTPATAGHTQA